MKAITFVSLGRRLANLYGALCAPICRRHGVNQTGFDILLFCANNPDHNTAHELTAVRGIKRSMASVSVESLIQGGYLIRQDDLQDRRVRRLVPTEKAQRLIEEGRAMQEQFGALISAGMTAEELDALRNVANKLEYNLSHAGIDTDPALTHNFEKGATI